ncbi:hypothetical protein T492DRAFT_878485, partial [Pavlovales sp. CCMP2436]
MGGLLNLDKADENGPAAEERKPNAMLTLEQVQASQHAFSSFMRNKYGKWITAPPVVVLILIIFFTLVGLATALSRHLQ